MTASPVEHTAPAPAPPLRVVPDSPFTERERQVTVLAADGMEYRQIAQALYLGPPTVKTHLARARRKAGATNTAQLVATALRNGWIA